MLKVGLTGGIASGKSSVGAMLVALGAHLVQADEIARSLMQPGEAVYSDVVREFGPDVLHPDGTINRMRLAEAAFSAPKDGRPRIEELNKFVHPAVVEKQDQWMKDVGRQDPEAIAIVEAALILEASAADHFDCLIVVTCQPEQRAERWARRAGVDLETAKKEVGRRMAAQFSEEVKVKAADYIIDNSGPLQQTSQRVGEVFAELKKRVAAKQMAR